MHDPFPLSPPPLLASLTKPVANHLGLTTLPLHIHELLLATLFYHLTCAYGSPYLSARFFPTIYPKLPARTKLNWDVHVVALVQSSLINAAALWVMWCDEERRAMGWEERVWGYSGAGGMIQGFAAGYFLWDLGICFRNRSTFGLGLLAHAMAALIVFSFGFRPFVNFYGPTFILYELSSPFLNFHWFFDKLHMTGSRPQWYNGMMLLFSFFSCRLVWGTYQSIRVYQDVWAGLHYTPPLAFSETIKHAFEPLGEGDETMRYAGKMYVPPWLACLYLGSNIVLNTLNFYWFGKMIETVKSRFRETKEGKKKRWEGKLKGEGVLVEGLVDASTVIDSVLVDTANGEVLGDASTVEGEMGEKGTAEVSGNSVEVQKAEVKRRNK